ncbi:MAG: DUF2723 domain-containing protein [Caldilineae bacterium]|nr:MAG: DUF2723 domain-containing protein [Caldilineae bacterium]
MNLQSPISNLLSPNLPISNLPISKRHSPLVWLCQVRNRPVKPSFSRRTEYLPAARVVVIALVAYTATLAPTVLLADGGEFQFVPWLPGIAHPTGYPLYVLLGWLFSHLLPLGEVAWRMNLFSAVTGAAAAGVVTQVALRLANRLFPQAPPPATGIAALVAGLTFAFGRTFWSQAVIAEVYSLHALFVALTLAFALGLADAPPDGRLSARRGMGLAFLFGLSLTHHRTMVLMLPALLALLGLRGYRRVSPAGGLKLALAVALPNLLYLYLPLIAPHVPYARLRLSPTDTLTLYDNTLRGFLAHVLGSVFAADVRPAAAGWERLALSLRLLRQQVGWVGGAFGLAGLVALWRERPALALTALSFFGFLAFNLIYFIGDVEVLFIPCWLVFSLWVGLGGLAMAHVAADAIVRRKGTRHRVTPVFVEGAARLERRMRGVLAMGLVGASLTLPLVLAATRYGEVNRRHDTLARQAWQEILSADLPAGAILLSNDRNEMMPMWYYQYVEGRRPDLLGLFPLITPEASVANVGRLLARALATGRPVYLVKPMPGLSLKADLAPLPPLPHAQLVRAMPLAGAPAHPADLRFGDRLRVTGYTLLAATRTLTVTLYWQVTDAPPAEDYTAYVHLVGADGTGLAQSDHRPGGVFYPPSLWSPGETLRDAHTLPLPASLPPGEYRLVVGLYTQPRAGVIANLGDGQTLTTVRLP